MVGTVLYPLTELAGLSSEAFALQRSKYAGREAVLEARISASGLRFNATVHCAPLHPHRLFLLRKQMDLLPPVSTTQAEPPPWRPGLFFEIPIERILAHAVYWYRWLTPWVNGYPEQDVAPAPPLDEFEAFDSARYQELSAVPRAHVEYLRRAKQDGRRPLMFVHVPHVLVAGPIETAGLRVITWDKADADLG